MRMIIIIILSSQARSGRYLNIVKMDKNKFEKQSRAESLFKRFYPILIIIFVLFLYFSMQGRFWWDEEARHKNKLKRHVQEERHPGSSADIYDFSFVSKKDDIYRYSGKLRITLDGISSDSSFTYFIYPKEKETLLVFGAAGM